MIIYVSHPYAGARVTTTELTRDYPDHVFIDPLDLFRGRKGRKSEEAILQDCIDVLLRCDAIALCEGWENSKGCQAELSTAREKGFPIYKVGYCKSKPRIVKLIDARQQLNKVMFGGKEEPQEDTEESVDVLKIQSFLSFDEILCQLAEEASELAQAALKLRRAITRANPTPLTLKEAKENLIEKYADVQVVIKTLELDSYHKKEINEAIARRSARWIKKLQEYQKQ